MIRKQDFEDGSILLKLEGVNLKMESIEFYKIFHTYNNFLEYEHAVGRYNMITYTIQ